MSGSRTVRKPALAVSPLPLPAVCGTETASHSAGGGKDSVEASGELDVPADAIAGLNQQNLVERAFAARMKEQGFACTPEAPEVHASTHATGGADHELSHFAVRNRECGKEFRDAYLPKFLKGSFHGGDG